MTNPISLWVLNIKNNHGIFNDIFAKKMSWKLFKAKMNNNLNWIFQSYFLRMFHERKNGFFSFLQNLFFYAAIFCASDFNKEWYIL